MIMEGLILLIELFRQRKPDDIVMTHHSNPRVGLSVFPQHGLDAVCSVPQVCGSLIDPGLKHHGKDSLDDIIIRIGLILGEDFGIGSLVLLTLVLKEPKSTLLFYRLEVVVRVELFFREEVGTEIAGTADGLREDWLDDDWTGRIGEDE